MRKFVTLIFVLQILFVWSVVLLQPSPTVAEESAPKGSKTRPVAKKKKPKEEAKKESEFENNVSDTKVSHKTFDAELDSEPQVDAIILLDSSGSMLRTDPKRLRDQAAKLFIRFLGDTDRVSLFQLTKK